MFGFAPLTSVPLSSLPAPNGRNATGFVTGGFGTPLAKFNQTGAATGFTTPTQLGTPRLGISVQVTGIAPNTKFGAPPKFGPNILQIVGNGADGETAFVDASPYYSAVTRNGSIAKSTAQSRYGSGSIALTGASTANNLSLGPSTLFELGGTPYTIEAQVYLNAYNASGGRLLSAGGSSATFSSAPDTIAWLLQTDSSGVSFTWSWYGNPGGGYGWYTTTLGAAISLNAWNHVEIACDNSTTRLFVEGALVASTPRNITLKGASKTLRVGALNGEATGATNAANAYIQQIRIRTDCLHTAAFTPPAVGLPSWIGELSSIAPTTQVPAPRSSRTQPASGFKPTQFGAAIGTKQQRPTGFTTTQVGAPRLFPYSPPPIHSTVFGNPRLFPFHVGPGIHTAHVGAVTGWQHWNVAAAAATARFGTPATRTNRTQVATSLHGSIFGTPTGTRRAPANTAQRGSAAGFTVTHLGAPRAGWRRIGQASGFTLTDFGTPNGVRVQVATGFASEHFGTAVMTLRARAPGFTTTHLGTPTSRITQHAAGDANATRWGLAVAERSRTYKAFGFATTRLGHPTGFSRINHPATGFTGGGLGTPTCHQRHRSLALSPVTQFGTPLLKRITQC